MVIDLHMEAGVLRKNSHRSISIITTGQGEKMAARKEMFVLSRIRKKIFFSRPAWSQYLMMNLNVIELARPTLGSVATHTAAG